MVRYIIEHGHSFKYAIEGLIWVVRTERNFRLQVMIGILVMVLALLFEVDVVGISLLFFSIFFVLICEMINTAIEEVVDLATSEWKKKAKIAKDVSAGMVLLASMCALGVGLLVLGPVVLTRFFIR